MKIGIFGGTFNPVHKAHINLAKRFCDAMKLDKLILIPTFIPPHKSAENLADAQHRLEMCRIASRELDRIEVSDFEILGEGRSYTCMTLNYLHEKYPDSELFLLMGADMFLTVQEWKNPSELFKLSTICAAARERNERTVLEAHAQKLEMLGARCVVLDIEPIPLSSTGIRGALAHGEDVSELLDAGVLEYIKRNGIYGAGL